MRRLSPLVLLFLCSLTLSALEIETAYPRYYEAGEIRTIGDYFGKGTASQRFRTVFPSSKADSGGQYFITRLGTAVGENRIAQARITLFTTRAKEPETRTWDLSGHPLSRWLYLGLTGGDWPDEEVLPLAWRIELLDDEGLLLAEWKSFLWEMP